MRQVMFNPGSQSVPEGEHSQEQAISNMSQFLLDSPLKGVTFHTDPEKDYAFLYADSHIAGGRYAFAVFWNGLMLEIQMPGCPLEQVRYMGEEGQNIFDFYRLYVDGHSWHWKYALLDEKWFEEAGEKKADTVMSEREAFYRGLSPDITLELEMTAERIHSCEETRVTMALVIGQELRKIKLKNIDLFMEWCKIEFPAYSHSTLVNYMNLADLYDREPELFKRGEHNQSALYVLGRTTTEGELLELSKIASDRGETLTRDLVETLGKSPPYLRKAYAHNEVRMADVIDVTQALVDADDRLYADCVRHQVKSPDVVEYLKRKLADERSTAYDDIMDESGTLNGFGWSVPLALARPEDINRYNRERKYNHIEEAMERRETIASEGFVTSDGRLIIDGLDKLRSKRVRVRITEL